MNYPAASSGVSQKALNTPRGGEYNPEVIKVKTQYQLPLFSVAITVRVAVNLSIMVYIFITFRYCKTDPGGSN